MWKKKIFILTQRAVKWFSWPASYFECTSSILGQDVLLVGYFHCVTAVFFWLEVILIHLFIYFFTDCRNSLAEPACQLVTLPSWVIRFKNVITFWRLYGILKLNTYLLDITFHCLPHYTPSEEAWGCEGEDTQAVGITKDTEGRKEVELDSSLCRLKRETYGGSLFPSTISTRLHLFENSPNEKSAETTMRTIKKGDGTRKMIEMLCDS